MRVVINPKYESARDFLHSIPELFKIEGQGILIDDRRNVIKVFDTEWGEWIVKAYKVPMFFQRYIYTYWRKSKAQRAFEFATLLKYKGIDTPEAVAYIEQKHKHLFSCGYFIYQKCNDPFVYPQLVDVQNFDKGLADAVAGFLAEIHANGVMHGDLNLTNILYHPEGNHYHFTIIDTNRCKFKKHLTKADCYKDLRRVTHRRDLYAYIIAKYAYLRGWSADKAVSRAMKALDHLEAKEYFTKHPTKP